MMEVYLLIYLKDMARSIIKIKNRISLKATQQQSKTFKCSSNNNKPLNNHKGLYKIKSKLLQ